MRKNMGTIDRLIRIVLAIIFGYLILNGTLIGVWAWVLGIIGVIFLLTSLIGSCPLYIPFRISTLKKSEEGEGT